MSNGGAARIGASRSAITVATSASVMRAAAIDAVVAPKVIQIDPAAVVTACAVVWIAIRARKAMSDAEPDDP
jgi:hypothetical protein